MDLGQHGFVSTTKIHRGGLAIAVVSVGVLIVLVAIAGWQWADSEPLDLAQWLPAVTGVATLMAAVVAAVYANGAFKLEAEREQRWTEAQKRGQAAGVAAWTGEVRHVATGAWSNDWTAHGFFVRNASDVPVTQVHLRLVIDGEGAGQHRLGVIPPQTEPLHVEFPRNSEDFETEFYGGDHDFYDRYAEFRKLRDRSTTVSDDEVAEISFRDAAGTYWNRTADGTLHEGVAAWTDNDEDKDDDGEEGAIDSGEAVDSP